MFPTPVKSVNRSLLTNKSTGMSINLAVGKKDPKEVIVEINRLLKDPRNDKTFLEEIKRQMIFREFALKALQQQKYRQPLGARTRNDPYWKRVETANTGIPIVDASIKDLHQGLPHNRARLLLARHLIRTKNLDPSDVAKYYAKYLKDYSPVLNTFNIVQAASGANFGEPYFRKSNVLSAAPKLDPNGEYQRSKGVEPEKYDHDAAIKDIINGNKEWLARWKKKQYIEHPLWPTKDKDKGKFFLANKELKAKGHFGSFYKNYLKSEKDYLQ